MDVEHLRGVRRAWDAIAASFDAARRRPWPPVVAYWKSLPAGARVLDAGVGGGRHAGPALDRGLRVVGVDLSRGLLRRAIGHHPRLAAVGGCLERLPFRDASFDAVAAVASLHHVRGRVVRLEVWRELLRVVRPGGPVLATAWARDQPGFERVDRAPTGGPSSSDEPGDAWVDWPTPEGRVPRFYHLFTLHELRHEADAAGARVVHAWSPTFDDAEVPRNHFVLVRRPEPL